jgi:hypothetical protein
VGERVFAEGEERDGEIREFMSVGKSRKKLPIPDDITKKWWWRRLVFVRFDEETHTTRWKHFVPEYPRYAFSSEWNMWNRKDELFAFRYELLKRILATDLPEWHALPIWLYSWISGVLSPKPERSVCGMFYPVAPENYAPLGNWVWDLTASDEALCKHFLARINEQRRKRKLPDTGDILYGIVRKKLPHQERRRGQRSRPVSWMAIEIFDLQTHQVRPLTDGERSRLSKARREIGGFKDAFVTAIENARRFTPESQRITEPCCIYSRFLDENFKKLIASRLQKE